MNKILNNAWVTALLLLLMTSCKDYESAFTGVREKGGVRFNGTILDFLEQSDEQYGVRFDSMLVVINGIPGLRDSLQKPSAGLTVFAIPNRCFEEAFDRLNNYRNIKQKGQAIYLSDLLIEPFTVIEKQPGETPEADSIIIEHHYDYRLQLDSMISKYIFRGNLYSDSLAVYTNGLEVQDFKFDYRMHLFYERQNASGIADMGRRRLVLSDRNNTQLSENWDRSETSVIDIGTSNGYIHILNDGHEFSFSKMISRFQNYGNEYIY